MKVIKARQLEKKKIKISLREKSCLRRSFETRLIKFLVMWVNDSLILQEKNQMDCDRFCEGIAIKMGRMNDYEMTDFKVEMIMWVDWHWR